MTPGRYDFPIRRGDTARLVIVLKTRNLVTNRRSRLPLANAIIEWRAGSVTKTNADGGGLVIEPDRSIVIWPMSVADTEGFPSGAVPYTVAVAYPTGERATVLEGTLMVKG